jgi:hypothetical protein
MQWLASASVRRTPPTLVGRGWVSFLERYAGGNMPQKIGGLLADDRPFRNGKLDFSPQLLQVRGMERARLECRFGFSSIVM